VAPPGNQAANRENKPHLTARGVSSLLEQPRKLSYTEVASVDIVGSRPAAVTGKADVLWEEMGICTIGATGVRVQAPRGGSAEITPGKAIFQQGLTATCKDLLK
jgi:hypothetical protein